jgi:hypothetical protein
MGVTPKGISASRGAAVLGLSEYSTPLTVWQLLMEEREPGFNEKHGYILPEKPDNAALRFGLAFESAVIELAERERGKLIIGRETEFFYNAEAEFKPGAIYLMAEEKDCYVTCHVDGLYKDINNPSFESVLHEGKTTSAFTFREKWGEPGTDHIPRAYQIQVQHQLLCTGAKEAVVSVLVFPETPDTWERMGWEVYRGLGKFYLLHKKGAETHILTLRWAEVLADMGYFHQYPVQAHPENQRVMVERYREFWHNHVLTGKPPEPRNYDDVKRLFTGPVGTIVCDAAMEAWWREYDAIRKEIGKGGAAAKRQEKLRLRILDRSRKLNPVMDDESQEKVVFCDASGNKLGQYSKAGGFR